LAGSGVSAVVLKLVRAFSTLSLVAVGGANAAVPEVRRIVVDQNHWMDDASFSHLFAISQAAPGPNVLLVSLVGWRLAGMAGLLACTAAMNLPSSVLAFAAARAWARWSNSRWVALLRRTLAPIAMGLIAASGVVMARASDHALVPWVITALVALFVVASRRNLLWALAASALAGVALLQPR
jgi:chromate transporter